MQDTDRCGDDFRYGVVCTDMLKASASNPILECALWKGGDILMKERSMEKF